MNKRVVRMALVTTAALAATAALGWARWAGAKLYYNGKVASSDVITRGGVAYVPIRDIAAALSMTVQTRDDGYVLMKAGGANQLEGLNGKVGDDLFNGVFRLKVNRVIRGSRYQRQFSKGDDLTAPEGEDIMAVVVRVKNGTQKTQMVDLMPGANTALTDENEHSFGPYSGGYMDIPERAPTLVPGAATDFALTFHVPKSAVLKDLIFSPRSLMLNGGPDFRVSLKEPADSR
jgi:hypothetical protein